VSDQIVIRRAGADAATASALADVLVDCVEGGASVGFMSPLTHDRAEAFWMATFDAAARGERIVLLAEEAAHGAIIGTVQVIVSAPENQPHRAEISKMLVHRLARNRGVGEALMRAAEAVARDAGKSLLVLDTASDSAERLYDRLGWHRVGVIPGYALWPDGGLVDTIVFYKELA
jgi:ribosomal protein S18 acetylase RimI-like enzyme